MRVILGVVVECIPTQDVGVLRRIEEKEGAGK